MYEIVIRKYDNDYFNYEGWVYILTLNDKGYGWSGYWLNKEGVGITTESWEAHFVDKTLKGLKKEIEAAIKKYKKSENVITPVYVERYVVE